MGVVTSSTPRAILPVLFLLAVPVALRLSDPGSVGTRVIDLPLGLAVVAFVLWMERLRRGGADGDGR